MIIFPAIDIIDSKPVRLLKGDFSTAKQVAGDALETANGFEKIGCEWIHMVDLDGSLKKEPVNAETFISVAKNTNMIKQNHFNFDKNLFQRVFHVIF